jgi:hypothetical protein
MRRAFAGLWLLLAGCDPTAGLADSANAAVPQEKRYFDGRGVQLNQGPWQRVVVDLDAETLYHLGARRLDDQQPTFHLFSADDRDGCEVTPNAGTWLVGKPPDATERLLPFVESLDERGRGRMRFTSLDCQVQDLVIEDAGRPYPRLYDHGFLIPTKHGYTFADPWLGEQREIAADLQHTLVWDHAVLLHADGQLKSFNDQFEPGDSWGEGLFTAVDLGGEFLVENADGIYGVHFDRSRLALGHGPVLPGACHLQRSRSLASGASQGWVAVQMPCDNPRPTLLRFATGTFELVGTIELPFEADARYVRPLIDGTVRTDDDPTTPIGAIYLSDVDADELGTLWAWQDGRAEPLELGQHTELDSAYLETPGTSWDGGAFVNRQELGGYNAYDWVRFRWDGTLKVVAERMLRSTPSGDTLVNFDGVAGDLPWFKLDSYDVLARGVPPTSGELASYIGTPHFARVDEYDGRVGRLRLGTTSELSSWSNLGTRVPPQFARFAWFMPALVFLDAWDEDTETGALTAYNYELDARVTIAEGVSSFDLTSYPLEGVVYAVPSGKQRGIWFSKAK